MLTHNHPSGDPFPSEADIKLTRDLIRAGQLLKIEVRDHVVMALRPLPDYCKANVATPLDSRLSGSSYLQCAEGDRR